MNIRNNFFKYLVPGKLLRRMVISKTRGKGIALMYHEVLPDHEGPEAWTVVKASDFRRQLKFIKDTFQCVTIDEALRRNRNAVSSDSPYAVITFDDGYLGNLTTALPIIEELRIPVHVFVATEATETGEVYWYDQLISHHSHRGLLNIDLRSYGLKNHKLLRRKNKKREWGEMQLLLAELKTLAPDVRKSIVDHVCTLEPAAPAVLRMMSVSQLQELSQSPFITIGGHSHCHNILTQIPDSELQRTININRQKLRDWTGQEIKHFSYPNGDYDARVTAAVCGAGYASAVTVQEETWTSDKEPFELPRLGVGRFDSLELFIARLGGFA